MIVDILMSFQNSVETWVEVQKITSKSVGFNKWDNKNLIDLIE